MRRDKLIKAAGRPPFSVSLDPIPDRLGEIRVCLSDYPVGIWSTIQGDWVDRRWEDNERHSATVAEAVAAWFLGDVDTEATTEVFSVVRAGVTE